MQSLLNLFEQLYHTFPYQVEPLPKAGSNRNYFRLYCSENEAIIGVIGKSIEENRSFLYLSEHFRNKGLPVPKILAISEDRTCYLQEDFGQLSLYEAVKEGREKGYFSPKEVQLLSQTIKLLPHIQIEGVKDLDFEACIEPRHFSPMAVMFDLNYFKYCFFKTLDLAYDEVLLENDFQKIAADLCKGNFNGFLYRDFQARNVLIAKDNTSHIIDYQGGMLGPLQYDVASFLWQASAKYPSTLRTLLVEEYLDELEKLILIDRKVFKKRLKLFVLFRLLQTLGAYGMRGFFERKKYFLESIPPAIENLKELLNSGVVRSYPYLEKILSKVIALPQLQAVKTKKISHSKYERQGELVIRVNSFSYKHGIPDDPSGNGGGYVFDCRSTHNPGRYEEYKTLTGLDQEVMDFLEEDKEILTFLASVYPLAEHHVERFLERGFTHVMFSFGCTGGRHRSVYSAQHLAEHLSKKYGCEVHLWHREQQINQVFERREKL